MSSLNDLPNSYHELSELLVEACPRFSNISRVVPRLVIVALLLNKMYTSMRVIRLLVALFCNMFMDEKLLNLTSVGTCCHKLVTVQCRPPKPEVNLRRLA